MILMIYPKQKKQLYNFTTIIKIVSEENRI